MAEKICITGVPGFDKDASGNYRLFFDGMVTDVSLIGVSSPASRTFSGIATSTNPNPLLPNWKSRVAAVASDYAFAQWGLTADQIIFLDFGVLGL